VLYFDGLKIDNKGPLTAICNLAESTSWGVGFMAAKKCICSSFMSHLGTKWLRSAKLIGNLVA